MKPNDYMKKILMAFLGLFAGSNEAFSMDIFQKLVFI